MTMWVVHVGQRGERETFVPEQATLCRLAIGEKPMKRDDVLRVLAQHREELEELGVASLSVFGSTARDEARADSDIDVLVEFGEQVGLFEVVAVKEYLEELLRSPVDLVTRDSLKRQIRERILKEAFPA